MIVNKRLLQAWHVLGGLLLVSVTVLSLIPGSDLPPAFPGADKIVHTVMYLMLAIWFGVHAQPRSTWLFVIFVNYGAAIEIAQLFVPERSFDLWDIAANSLGALLGILLVRTVWNPLLWLNGLLERK